jgi:YD repeat-containing protein
MPSIKIFNMLQLQNLGYNAFKAALCFVIIFVGTTSYSQSNNSYIPTINIPTSPEVGLITRYGNIPVGFYTGTNNASIPLYSIKEGSVEIPLALNYQGGGIKVDEQATWVGLGWDLLPEGTIVQEIRGKADEDDITNACVPSSAYDQFLLRLSSFQDNRLDFLFQQGRETAPNFCQEDSHYNPSDPFCAINQLLEGRRQPDIYSYNFNGYTGKFYINPDNQQIVMIEKNEQVIFQKLSAANIKATTLDGTVFQFSVVETANGGIDNEYTGKTYKVENINFLNGKTINFQYTTNSYTEMVITQSAEITHFDISYPISESHPMTFHTKKTLKKITTPDAIIDFNTGSRDDINIFSNDNLTKLNSIDITSRLSGKKVKSFQFTYSYFPYIGGGVAYSDIITAHPDQFGKRLKLESVREIGYDQDNLPVTTPPYELEYDMSVTMPMKVSFAKDFWGYFNGEFQNQTLLPNLDYFDYLNQPDYRAINTTISYPYTGANRYTDNTQAGAYMLKKIIYPTGGYSEFEYEPNSFTNQFIPDKSTPVYKIVDAYDNSIASQNLIQFKLSRATTIHFDNSIRNGQGNYNGVTPLTYSEMAGCFIKFYKSKIVAGVPQVTMIKTWDLSTVLNADFEANGGKYWVEDLRVSYDPDPDPTFTYNIQVDYPNSLNNNLLSSIAGVRANLTFYDNTGVDTSVSNHGGMRIKSIKNYTQTGSLAGQKLIKYYDGKLLSRFRPLTVYKANHLDESGVSSGNAYEYIAYFNKITVSGNDFGTGGGLLIGYGKVEEIDLEGGVSTAGKKVYYYHNVENITAQGCPTINNKQNGLLEKEEVYDHAGAKQFEKIYLYNYLQPFPQRFVAASIVRLSTGSKVPCANLSAPTPFTTQYYESLGPYSGSQYGYNVYTINSEWSKLASVTAKQYLTGGTFTTTETYTYNSEGSIKTLTTTNSKGQLLISKYYYPTDYMINSITDDYMVNVHNTGTPVIIEQYNGTNLLTRQRTVYDFVSGGPSTMLPKYIFVQNKNNPEEKRLTLNNSDDKGNITQYTEENNIPVSFVWNADKTLPIAKIENATYASLLALPGGLNADFRASLPNARVTTFTYHPLIGVKTITDINNKTMTYEYDAFGKLRLVRDQDGNILKIIEYKYQQQQ